MEKIKLYLVVSSSKSYRSFAKDQKLKDWSYGVGSAKIVPSLSFVGRSDMFGNTSPAIIEAPTKEAVATLLAELEALSEELIAHKFRSGLIIISECPIVSTKKLQAKVLELDGEVMAKTKDDQKSLGKDLFSGLSVSREVQNYLLEWSGEEPEQLLGIIGFLSGLSKEKQRKVSVEHVKMQLSKNAGDLSIFGIENPVFAGNFVEAVRIGRRSEYNAATGMLYRKVHSIYKAACILDDNPKASSQEISDALGIKGGQIYYITRSAKSIKMNKLEAMLDILAPLSSSIKSGAPLSKERFEIALYKLCEVSNHQ